MLNAEVSAEVIDAFSTQHSAFSIARVKEGTDSYD
jgi:hypothetical protein